LVALKAVLADIERFACKRIICLGDIIGYGPKPLECIDLSMGFSFTILGNHEDAVLFEPVGFNVHAEGAITWTRSQLNDRSVPVELRRARWNFLGDLPRKKQEGDILYVHGTVKEPTREYLFPKDITDKERIAQLFKLFDHIVFCGHTHVAGIFTPEGYISPPIDRRIDLDGFEKVIVNVGAVGQPRDSDWRASYVLFDGRCVVYRRIEYDIQTVVDEIRSNPNLDGYLAERLVKGM
jgi:diadenosine tetraphosphatase ApaH/serine/threonine PP2A family protein phosphatase